MSLSAAAMKRMNAAFPHHCRPSAELGLSFSAMIMKNAVAINRRTTVMAFGRVRRRRSDMPRG